MPQDAVFGRDLAERISAVFTGKVQTIEFTYDGFVELDRLEELPEFSYCRVSPQLYEQIRETRAHWRETIQLVVTMLAPVGPTSNSQWVDDWLDSWDLLVRQMREMPVLGKHKPMSIDIDARYDDEMFHNHNRLLTQALVNFSNVEVI